MTETETLAPHQAALARMLGKRDIMQTHNDQENSHSQSPDGDPAQPIRDGWLQELRERPSIALEGLQRTVQEHRGDAAQSQMLADLALKFSENRDRAEPEPTHRPCGSPGARVNLARDGQPVRVPLASMTGGGGLQRLCPEHREELNGRTQAVPAPGDAGGCDWPVRQREDHPAAWCDYCGATQDLEETDSLGTGDRPCTCHGMLTRPCKDTEACSRRREERMPPSLDRVPSWVFEAQARLTDAGTRQMIMAATAAALGDFLELVAKEDEQTGLELAQPVYGAWDTRGDWFPYQPAYNINWAHINWSHTISGGAHMGHAISGNHLTPARISAMAKVSAARGAQAAPDGAPDAGGHQGAQHQIPAEGLAPGVAEALHGGTGHDIQLQAPELPEGSPQRPVPRPRRPQYGRRRGRKAAFGKRVLKYQGR